MTCVWKTFFQVLCCPIVNTLCVTKLGRPVLPYAQDETLKWPHSSRLEIFIKDFRCSYFISFCLVKIPSVLPVFIFYGCLVLWCMGKKDKKSKCGILSDSFCVLGLSALNCGVHVCFKNTLFSLSFINILCESNEI